MFDVLLQLILYEALMILRISFDIELMFNLAK